MTLTDNAIRRIVAEPAFTNYRFGLQSVLTFAPDVDHWRNGITWLTPSCGQAGVTFDSCLVSGEVDPKTFDDACDGVGRMDPFVVYTATGAAVMGMPKNERQNFLVAQLERSEWPAVENHLMGLIAVDATDLGAGTPVQALAAVEQNIATEYGGEGVIWTSRAGATALAAEGLLTRSGSRLETILGTPVVAGVYDADTGTIAEAEVFSIFGTGALVAYRSTVEVFEGLDRSVNRHASLAERTYAIGWDCTPFKAAANFVAAP